MGSWDCMDICSSCLSLGSVSVGFSGATFVVESGVELVSGDLGFSILKNRAAFD